MLVHSLLVFDIKFRGTMAVPVISTILGWKKPLGKMMRTHYLRPNYKVPLSVAPLAWLGHGS